MQHEFEFDEAKSRSNESKHGIDFVEAQLLWLDEDLLRITARTVGDEKRYVFIGIIGTKHYSAVATYRSERIRLISVRRSHASEVAAYEGE